MSQYPIPNPIILMTVDISYIKGLRHEVVKI